jgi:hypothetical protein
VSPLCFGGYCTLSTMTFEIGSKLSCVESIAFREC